jgi:hypothetical protein
MVKEDGTRGGPCNCANNTGNFGDNSEPEGRLLSAVFLILDFDLLMSEEL